MLTLKFPNIIGDFHLVLGLQNLARVQAARGLQIVCPTTQSLYEMEADGALHVELGHQAAVVSCNAVRDCILDNDTILSLSPKLGLIQVLKEACKS